MNDELAIDTGSLRRIMLRIVLVVFGLVFLCVLVWLAWRGGQQWQAEREDKITSQQLSVLEQHLSILQQDVQTLQREQQTHARNLQDLTTTHRVLREEVLGLGQRNAIQEETLARLTDNSRRSTHVAHLEEAELLLSQAQQRLAWAADLDSARRLYALAAGALERIDHMDSPDYLNLRQALLQERTVLEQLGEGIRSPTSERLARWEAHLAQLPQQMELQVNDALATNLPQPWWQRLLAPLVQIRPTDSSVLLAQSERSAATDALQIELSLARAALERGDTLAWQQALERVDDWLLRLWPPSSLRQQQRQELTQLHATDLRPPMPELGSTLQQLRRLRNRFINTNTNAAPPPTHLIRQEP